MHVCGLISRRSAGGYSGGPAPANRNFVEFEQVAGDPRNLLGHEAGHYLGLDHPFRLCGDHECATDQEIFDLIQSCGQGVDCFDGDGLSDTPPDPGSTYWTTTLGVPACDPATPSAAVRTAAGPPDPWVFTPDRNNVMSYWFCEPSRFSRQQAERVRRTLGHPMRRPLTEPPGSLHVPREIFGYRGLCLQPAGSVALAGAGLETAGCSGAAAQKWTFTTRGEVRHRASGLCLRDGEDGRPALAACATGDARQAWLRAFSGDLVGHSGLCLDVAGASASDPAPVILWPCTASGSENQKWWSFYPEVQGSGGPPN